MIYTWDKEARVYRYPNGEAVDDEILLDWISDFGAGLAALYATRARRLQSAIINIDDDPQEVRDAYTEWNFQTAEDIKASYLAASAAAFGGFQNATDIELGIGEDEARRQLAYWTNLVGEVSSGAAITGFLATRSAMYGEGVFAAFSNAVRFREGSYGANQERRVLGAADHCTDCLEQAALGWVAYGSLRPIGDSVCRSRCRCRFEYRYA